MTLRELVTGQRIQVSCPPPGVIGKHWIDAVVFECTPRSVHVGLVGHPAWKKHWVGLVLNARDLKAGLVRRLS